MSDDFDLALFGDSLVKPSTGEEADPVDVLANKVVSVFDRKWSLGMNDAVAHNASAFAMSPDSVIFWSSLV